jgi:sigma-B regulation protein RsbU (phosphoserine phosphatase)
MVVLITLQGPESGRQFVLDRPQMLIGRQADADICLPARAVSRHHAQIHQREEGYYIEDLGSSNGTFVNGQRLPPHTPRPFREQDQVQIGPYVLGLRLTPRVPSHEPNLVIREELSALDLTSEVYAQTAAQRLQAVLELLQQLARTLDVEMLLHKFLDQLMTLFPQAEHGMVLLCEEGHLVVRGQRSRQPRTTETPLYSRTIVAQALEKGVGILSEDIQSDDRFPRTTTITALNLHALLCAPLLCPDGRRLGVIQLDCSRPGAAFRSEDLHLLTTIALVMAVVLDNAALHAERLREERLRRELALAREIQQGLMPTEFGTAAQLGYELFAVVHPAREVSGDLYDFAQRSDGRLSFFIGDVSGKGIPAALFMVAVRTLCRHLAAASDSPTQVLSRLNQALARDNPLSMFVTLIHGLYEPHSGALLLASGGHPLPLIRHANGQVSDLPGTPGRLLGYGDLELHLSDISYRLSPGDLAVFYTDGVTEAHRPGGPLFGKEHLRQLVATWDHNQPLSACAEQVKHAVQQFTGSTELADDLTLLLLRRPGS